MKNLIGIQLFLIFGFNFSTTFSVLAQSHQKTEQTNYVISRYVISSGGVIWAQSTNYLHFATAGETVIAGTQNDSNNLLSGYWHPGAFISADVKKEKEELVPDAVKLHQNYPNPFNPRTTIKYDLPYSSEVTIEIYNFLGQKIRLLIDSQNQGPGYMQVIWDGRDDQGSQVASGIYMYRITISKATLDNQENETPFQQTQKMLFVK